MYNPVSTYRIQFHKGFTFADFEQIIPYLKSLGIKTVYASPIFAAVPGSMHGYDVTDPSQINPEIGTLEQLKSISIKLKDAGIGWLQDIVPNHMAFHPDNRRLMDVLANGRDSRYADFFDIIRDDPENGDKLMVPFLGKPLHKAVEEKELQICDEDDPAIDYFGTRYPLNDTSVKRLMREQQIDGPAAFLSKVNEDARLLLQLLDAQHYRLCCWQETDRRINYRRFFTVNSLICLNMQRKEVFDEYHALIYRLLREGVFQGLRVDHIDGLYDPETYLVRLRQLAGPEAYIVVEKILEEGEQLPGSWPVQGTTGYDFLAAADKLFMAKSGAGAFTQFYETIEPQSTVFSERVFEKKRLILGDNMQGELDNLYRLFISLRLVPAEAAAAAGEETWKALIAEMLVRCPVYRFYGNTMPLPDDVSVALRQLIQQAGSATGKRDAAAELEKSLLVKPATEDDSYRQRALQFFTRLMQFTGPLMAKGVEDTLMYTYNRFIGLNEVGDSPGIFGIGVEDFHRMIAARRSQWPLAMNTTATHDTKRGEDVRARLAVLTDVAAEWTAQVKKWQQAHTALKTNDAPDANDEYFIYQTLIGSQPMPNAADDDFGQRLERYLEKALREGKRNTGWAQPDEAYEAAAKRFAAALLQPQGGFLSQSAAFRKRVADYGMVNSLSQTLLKYIVPGIPDLYQGGELWDLSMVDPDNRRPVDYRLRSNMLQDNADWPRLWQNRYDGRIKLILTSILLKARAADPETFSRGGYLPVRVTGVYRENIFAFARYLGGSWYLAVVPLHAATIAGADLQDFDWKDTCIALPPAAPRSWTNMLTGSKGYAMDSIAVNELFSAVPVALLRLHESGNGRGAGILMHITSLPSSFGIGDIGPQAYRFADFLFQSRQRYWQMLPLSPVDAASGYSPYSAASAMAANELLISPELLARDGLLPVKDLKNYIVATESVDYEQAALIRRRLFPAAYARFLKIKNRAVFEAFKRSEAWWLDDFAAYCHLKITFGGAPWYKWPAEYKCRRKAAAEDAAGQAAIDRIKWLQFIFNEQWQALRRYCAEKNIRLVGDMPFYISYDSADVWAHPELFKLDSEGRMTEVAGVPPDYFSATGQLWGMPVYRWDKLKATGYAWWLDRIKRNLNFFDLLRLDHFRAFSAYWEVPGGSENAINGHWEPGPGSGFLGTVKHACGNLPFIAEDLGQIDDSVYQLRDQFKLPGMRVLQFAFDDSMPVSVHIPHNYDQNSFAYTGTHDNNTIKGWYENNMEEAGRQRLRNYMGVNITAANVSQQMINACYASVAKAAIIPMQDILGLGEAARMNVPSSAEGNWRWRLAYGALTPRVSRYLNELSVRYNR